MAQFIIPLVIGLALGLILTYIFWDMGKRDKVRVADLTQEKENLDKRIVDLNGELSVLKSSKQKTQKPQPSKGKGISAKKAKEYEKRI
jgi:predicted  nucleic acid-binding Zn-ribbon protein